MVNFEFVRKLLLQSTSMISSIILSFLCGSFWITNNATPEINFHPLVLRAEQQENESLKKEGHLGSQLDDMQREIKRESAKLRIQSLKEDSANPRPETRIWVGFGLFYPRCLILKGAAGKRTAVYLGTNEGAGPAAKGAKSRDLITHTVLDVPISGWDKVDRFLIDQGIESLLKLSLDNEHVPDPDEEIIVVEVKSGTLYSMVFFSPSPGNADGRKVVAVCRMVEREFNVIMGC